jgi:hypothetical protein
MQPVWAATPNDACRWQTFLAMAIARTGKLKAVAESTPVPAHRYPN